MCNDDLYKCCIIINSFNFDNTFFRDKK